MSETQPLPQTKASLCKAILHNILEALSIPVRCFRRNLMPATLTHIPLFDEEESEPEAIYVLIKKDSKGQTKLMLPTLPNQTAINIRTEYLNDYLSFEAIPTELVPQMTGSQPV